MFQSRNRTILWSIPVLFVVCLVSFPAQAKYSGGTGEPNDPYRIATAADLIALGETPADYDKHFILTADIDLDPNLPGRRVFDRAIIAPDTNDATWEFEGNPFAGVFGGDGHTISHLTIEGGSYLGLFGQLASGAEAKNLGVVDVKITGLGVRAGGLAGRNDGAVIHCHTTGTVKGTVSGGLVGLNLGTVVQCYSAVRASGGSAVGGLVGSNSGAVTHCYATGDVTGTIFVGGLVGYQVVMDSTIAQCYSTGAVSGTECVGGLVGYLPDSWNVTQSFWDIETSGQASSEGGTGKTTAEMQDIRTYEDAGWDFPGTEDGLYDIWQMPEGGGYPVLAGGYTPARLQGLGTPENPYLISNAVELAALAYYDPSAHYRLGASIDLSGIRWGMALMPRLAGTFDGNNLTISHLTVRGERNVGLFGKLVSGAEIRNLQVIDVNVAGSVTSVGGLAGENYGRVIGCQIVGVVRGASGTGGVAGHNAGTVTQCYTNGTVSGTDDVGGVVGGNGGDVNQCTSIAAVSSSGQYGRAGGLVGENGGDVSDCRSDGPIRATRYVGGAVGWNFEGGTVTQCWSTGDVSGTDDYVGGLAGQNEGTITHCYSTSAVSGRKYVGGLEGENWGEVTASYSAGAVSGTEWVGGLVGNNPGAVTRCYSTGAVSGSTLVGGLVGDDTVPRFSPRSGWHYVHTGVVTGGLWDVETAGQAVSAGGTGKTTAEMETAKTFLDAGWDFVGETANGTEDTWWINEGKDYPRLWWEAHD